MLRYNTLPQESKSILLPCGINAFEIPPTSNYSQVPYLSKLTLDQTLYSPSPRPGLHNLEPNRLDKRMSLLFRPLLGREVCHHDDTQTLRVGGRDHVLIDQDIAVATHHGRHEVGEDAAAVRIRTIVEDGVHVVGSGTYFVNDV